MTERETMKLLTTSLTLLAVLVFAFTVSTATAAPPAQGEESPGESYVVQAGDTLSALAKEYYAAPQAYSAIVEGTNRMVLWDDSFTVIIDPDILRIGQKLWVPLSAA